MTTLIYDIQNKVKKWYQWCLKLIAVCWVLSVVMGGPKLIFCKTAYSGPYGQNQFWLLSWDCVEFSFSFSENEI